MARMAGFINDTATNIEQLLQFADSWSARHQENAAMNYFNTVTQADLDPIFGTGVVTVAQFQAALAQMDTIVDSIHVQTTAAKLYRLMR